MFPDHHPPKTMPSNRQPFRASFLPTQIKRIMAATLLAGPAWLQADVVSRFNADAEGWGAVDGIYGSYGGAGTAFAVTYSGSGGNPGGHISATDPSDNTFAFEAPSAFLGNKSAYYGGRLKFDLKVNLNGVAVWDEGVEVVLAGNSLTLTRDIGINPPADWTSYSFDLTETGWRVGGPGGALATQAEFQSVLGNLSRLRIIGEYGNGVAETSSLDNVGLVQVPELASTAFWTAGGLGLFALLRRNRQS